MTHVRKLILLAVAACAIAVVGAGTANAATTDFSCNISGSYAKAQWSGSCTSGLGPLTCKGTTSGPNTGGTLTGTCSGTTTLGKTTCNVTGSYTSDGTTTWSGNINASCKAGFFNGTCTASGGGSVNAKRQTYSGTETGVCNY